VALRLIHQMFSQLLSWIVLCTRSATSKQIEILVLCAGRRALAVRRPVGARNCANARQPARSAADGTQHDPPVAVTLIYRMFVTLLSWIVLRTRSDTTNEIEILVLRHQLTVL
jgi:hypothetical protein